MIISANRRTDIPANFTDWFFHRIREGYVLVRNPFNPRQVSKVSLSPEVVDCIVFWTKNPKPMLGRLPELKDYPYYFQFTLNPYGRDIETNMPSKSGEVVDTFRRLSDMIGPENVIWRYDPILLNETYTVEYHAEFFYKLAERLGGYAKKCTISFIDIYPSIRKRMEYLGVREINTEDKQKIAGYFSETGRTFGLEIDTCAEDIELGGLGIQHGQCIDGQMISQITGCPIAVEKAKNQRPNCGCAASIDIGAYNTCRNGCKYCYANHSENVLGDNLTKADSASPLLCGKLEDGDVLKERIVYSEKDVQGNLFY